MVTAGTAAACTCTAGAAAGADAIFVGELVGRRVEPPTSTLIRSGVVIARPSPVVLTFKVSRVIKGSVGERQEIVTPGGGQAACGFETKGSGPYRVVAFDSAGDMYELEPGQYASNLCSGSRAIADGGMAVGGITSTQLAIGVGLLVLAGLAILGIRRRPSGSS